MSWMSEKVVQSMYPLTGEAVSMASTSSISGKTDSVTAVFFEHS